MTDAYWPTPVGSTLEKEPGFDAVRRVYGESMVQNIKNWPEIARSWYTAQDPGDTEGIAYQMEQAHRAMERCRGDKEEALRQAEVISRRIPKREWDLVPGVAALKADWPDPKPLPAEGFPPMPESMKSMFGTLL